jgi:hypothetical protein
MAYLRTIKQSFFTSEDVVALSPVARLLYIGLWTEADREGRFTWKPVTFRLRYLPTDACDMEAVTCELLSRGLVVRYGDGLAYIPSFAKHQRPNAKEAASQFPAPTGESTRPHACASSVHASEREESPVPTGETRVREVKEREVKEREVKGESNARPTLVPFDNEYGAMPTRKRNPAMAWEGQREGLGVPDKLHRDLLSRLGTPDEAALLAWYAETERAWQGRAVGETCWQFWNARFTEWQGQTPTARRGHRPYGVGVTAPSSSVAVVDPDYNGAPYRFHCQHRPTCTTWPQHRDMDADTAVSA